MNDKCYRCDAQGVTTEHVPPQTFFPKGFRRDLWTVRSCYKHNCDNSKDVEYVRNIIVGHWYVDNEVDKLAQGAAIRSFERRPALISSILGQAKTIRIDDELTATFQVDLARFTKVMEAIANAIYFRENGISYERQWLVMCPMFLSEDDLTGNLDENWAWFKEYLSKVIYEIIPTPEPKVFKCGVCNFNDGRTFSYAFDFYEGFCVYLWSAPIG